MAKFISQRNPVSKRAIKRKTTGTVIVRHSGRESVKFTRVAGGYMRERMDVTERPSIVSSADVVAECNNAMGCKSSWARVY